MSGGGSSGAGAGGEAEVSSAVLSAPPGWTKKVTPLKGGTPKRKEIIFVAPTGEELSSKRQVEKYLKSHPGGPELSEFYWGSGETPRRSARLKTKEVDTPESEPPKKRSRKSLEKKGDDTETEAALEEEQGEEVDTPESEPPKKQSRKSLEKKGDDTKTKAALEEEQGDDVQVDTPESEPPKKQSRKSLEKKGDDTKTKAALEEESKTALEEESKTALEEEEQGDDVQMHDTEVAVAEVATEVKAAEETPVEETPEVKADEETPVEETPDLNKIDDLRAPVAPSGDVVKESTHVDSVETKDDSVETKKDDTVAEGTTEEILISDNIPLSGDTEFAVKDDTKNGKAPEDLQVKVDINVQEDVSNEQQVKVDCPEVVVGEKDVARETEHMDWTRDIQVEDGNLPSSTLFDDKKGGDSGSISEVTAADTTPKVTGNSCINPEDGEVKPQPPQQKYAIDLEQLPAP